MNFFQAMIFPTLLVSIPSRGSGLGKYGRWCRAASSTQCVLIPSRGSGLGKLQSSLSEFVNPTQFQSPLGEVV